MRSPQPRRSGWAHCFAHSPSRISLPRKGCRAGLRIVLFEACSAFTRVTACTFALPTPSPWRRPVPTSCSTFSPGCSRRSAASSNVSCGHIPRTSTAKPSRKRPAHRRHHPHRRAAAESFSVCRAQGRSRTLPVPPCPTASWPSGAALRGNFRSIGMTSFPALTACAMARTVWASCRETYDTTLMDG
jgi:hypothetical protein